MVGCAMAAALPMGNEEADMMGGWNHQLSWHSDAYNAAGLVRILAMHEDMVNVNATFTAKGVKLGYIANDNAFLNYVRTRKCTYGTFIWLVNTSLQSSIHGTSVRRVMPGSRSAHS